MKNYEKYADKIRECKGMYLCDEFVKPYILGRDSCDGVSCEKCSMLQVLWLMEEYKEPEIDWSKVAVDTSILVSDNEDGKWIRRYFAKYDGKFVYAWNGGCTSWSEKCMTGWEYAKLAETEGETK